MQVAYVTEYLERIQCSDVRLANPDSLALLHVAHLSSVPFENLSIHRGERIQLSSEWLFGKIVRRRRGGFCYELNGLFAELLLALGFGVQRLAARVYDNDGRLGIPFDHLCLRVEAGGDAFLCDVGFGDCFVKPLRFDDEKEQHDGRALFRLTSDEGERDLWVRDREGTWRQQYRFSLKPHELSDFDGGCLYHQTASASPFTQKRVCSMLTSHGRITLRDDRFIERIGDQMNEVSIDAGEWSRLLRERFGISEP